MKLVMDDVEIIEKIVARVERKLGKQFDRASHNYLRFVSHLRYLIRRLRQGDDIPSSDSSLLDQVCKDFPRAWAAAKSVARRLERKHGWVLSNKEMLYLILYIHRLDTGA